MKVIYNPSPNPRPKPISFGIYKHTIPTRYGNKVIGEYKNKTITVHNDLRNNTKMIYVEKANKWIKSKLIYLMNGFRKIVRSNSNEF